MYNMKKLILTLLCSVWGAVAAQSTDGMTPSYKCNLSQFEIQLLEFQHLHNMNVDFSESVKPRKLEFRQIVLPRRRIEMRVKKNYVYYTVRFK